MIYTMALNPVIDSVTITKELEADTVNRTKNFELRPNGKGVNISFILKKMGIENMATGIRGGFTLDYVTAGLEEKGIKTKLPKVKEPARIDVSTRVLDQNMEYKEVNPGPEVGPEVQDKFLRYLRDILKVDDTLIILGSFSKGIKAEYLIEVARITVERDIRLVIDPGSKVVLDTLQYRPYLSKPNDQELASFSDLDEKLDQEEIIELAHKSISAGCQDILVSLSENEVVLINKDHAHFGNASKIRTLNTAGTSDTMLGIFIGEKSKAKSDTAALKSTIAAVSDTASRFELADFKLEKYLKEI